MNASSVVADRKHLLRAALSEGAEAEAGWRAWIAGRDLADITPEAFALLPTIYARHRASGLLAESAAKLAGIYRWSWVRNQLAIRMTSTAVGRLAEKGIPAIPLKGVPLLLGHYGDLGARMMFDVDLLIPEGRVYEAIRLLGELGWLTDIRVPPPRILPLMYSITFRDPGGMLLDLHWKPIPLDGPPGAWEGLIARAAERKFPGLSARVPSPEDLALLIVLHSKKYDPHARFRWMVDLATIARSTPSLDWNSIVQRATEWGFGPVVRDSLNSMREATGIVPESVTAAPAAETAEEARRREILTSCSVPQRSAYRVIRDHRRMLRDVHARRGAAWSPPSLPRFLLDYYRIHWGTRGILDTALFASRRLLVGSHGRNRFVHDPAREYQHSTS